MQKRYVAEAEDRFHGEHERGEAGREGIEAVGKTFQTTTRWDYRRVDRPPSDGLMTEEQLNSLGHDGWELAAIVNDSEGVHYILKRRRGGG